MDKIEITANEIEELLKWRDEHKDLMRRCEMPPLRTVEIVIRDNGYRIKAIREGDELRLHLNIGGRPVGKGKFRLRFDGMWVAGKNDIKFEQKALGDNNPSDVAQSMLTVYCSLMKLMIHSNIEKEGEWDEPVPRKTAAHKPAAKGSKKPSKRITYILRSQNGALYAAPRGSHSSPKGVFSVRGHYRHYRDGKVVWIAEYSKGTGKKKKSKTYRMGGKENA